MKLNIKLDKKNMSKKFTVTVEYDEELGDYVLPFPDELILDLDWHNGDVIQWIDNNDGSWTLKKKET